MPSRDYGTNETEQRLARSVGAVPHKNSGRGMVKGDATYRQFTMDIKEGKTFRLTVSNWAKVCTDAIKNRADPLLFLILDKETRLAVVEWDIFEDLVRKADLYDREAEE